MVFVRARAAKQNKVNTEVKVRSSLLSSVVSTVFTAVFTKSPPAFVYASGLRQVSFIGFGKRNVVCITEACTDRKLLRK